METYSRTQKTLSAIGVGLVLSSCSPGEKTTESVKPNVTSEVVLNDTEGKSNIYDYAYGVGLNAGCNPELYLEGPNLKEGTSALRAYDFATLIDSAEAILGFNAGKERGIEERASEQSDVC